MEIKDALKLPEITDDDKTLLKEIFSHPSVVKYLTSLIGRAVLDIALTGITSDESPEEYIRKEIYIKGGINAFNKLLSIAETK